jgi:hypothetical protein
MQSVSTTPDIKDIPAGVFGAILYYIVRSVALRIAAK